MRAFHPKPLGQDSNRELCDGGDSMAVTRRVLKRLDEGPYKIRRNESTQARLH